VTCAIWVPVVRPTDAVAGRPRRSSSQEPATDSAAAAAGRERGEPGVLVPHDREHVRGQRRGQGTADDVAEEPRRGDGGEPGAGRGHQGVDDVDRLDRAVGQRQIQGLAELLVGGPGGDRPVATSRR
jgi:hypothetical protein